MTTLSVQNSPVISGTIRLRSTRRRDAWERCVRTSLVTCGGLTMLTTAAIIIVLARETWKFFESPEVSIVEFLTGTTWSPLLGAEKHFGIWPLVCGTLLVTGAPLAERRML